MLHWIQLIFGFQPNDGNSASYLFWSGFGSDLAYISFLWAAIVLYRKHDCGVRWCWRLGKHDFTETDSGIVHNLCRKHHPLHPGKPVTAAQLQQKYHLYLGKKPGRG